MLEPTYEYTLLTGERDPGQLGLGFARASLNSSDFLWISLDSDLKTCIRLLPSVDTVAGAALLERLSVEVRNDVLQALVAPCELRHFLDFWLGGAAIR